MCFGAYKYSYMWCDSWTSPNPGIDLGSSLNLGLRPWPESPGVSRGIISRCFHITGHQGTGRRAVAFSRWLRCRECVQTLWPKGTELSMKAYCLLSHLYFPYRQEGMLHVRLECGATWLKNSHLLLWRIHYNGDGGDQTPRWWQIAINERWRKIGLNIKKY